MANNKICVVCNSSYRYCTSCPDKENDGYSFLFDSKNCNDIWEIFNAYRTHTLSANDALTKLQQCDLSKEASFKPVWKELLAKIRSEAAPVAVDAPVITEASPSVEEDTPAEDEPEQRFKFRKRKFQ